MRPFPLRFSMCVLTLFALSMPAAAQLPAIEIETAAEGFSQAIGVTNAGDGSGRLFVIQQSGQIRIWDGAQVLATPFLDIDSIVLSGGEQGLLGLAFHPSYDKNGHFYVNYTDLSGDTVVARYTVSAGNPDVAGPASAQTVLTFSQPATNHNAGDMHFGPDGYLYVASGDGGDVPTVSQQTSNLLGKILRVDVDGDDFPADPDRNYAIPPDNPLVGVAGAAEEIYILGLRNPFRFSFDRQTGDLFIGDVGEGEVEEVTLVEAATSSGANLGWPCYEGGEPFLLSGCGAMSSYLFPVFELTHGAAPNNNCSVIGGFRYRGMASPSLTGVYFFSDWCTGVLWGGQQVGGNWIQNAVTNIGSFTFTGFGEDEQGEIYIAGGFSLLRIVEDRTELFDDGFESGDLTTWSLSEP